MALRLTENSNQLPVDVHLHTLTMHHDGRGWLAEIYRENWYTSFSLIQWNTMFSKKAVMRGVGVHRSRCDYFTMVKGAVEFGLKDIRINSPTENLTCTVILGIAHGLSFLKDTVMTFGFDCYFDPNDELQCHWQDPDLGIQWTRKTIILNKRDHQAPSLKTLIQQIGPFYYQPKRKNYAN